MLEKLETLEKVSRHLDPTPDLRHKWARQAFAYADKFISELDEIPAFYPSAKTDPVGDAYRFDEEGSAFEDIIRITGETIDPSGINAASGFHFGYIPGGGLYPSALGDFLADITNRYAGVHYAAPHAVALENHLIRWMCRLMGFPAEAGGNLTSGGSIANLIALVTARESRGVKARDFHKLVIYTSREAHHSLQKAIRIAGLAEAQIRYLRLDNQLRILPSEFEMAVKADLQEGRIPFYFNASLGTTNTGAIDPVGSLGEIARQYSVWFHVDAAYGGFFKLVDGMADPFRGVERADSITLDPHKTLFLPYGSGAVIIRNRDAMYKAHNYTADYMQDAVKDGAEISPADISPELTKPFRGMRLWLPLKIFGLRPFRAALEEKLLLAQYAYRELQNINGVEVGPEPQLSVVLFRFNQQDTDLNALNKQRMEAIQNDGEIFLSSTVLRGDFWIRIAIVVFRSHKSHVDRCLEIIKGLASQNTE